MPHDWSKLFLSSFPYWEFQIQNGSGTGTLIMNSEHFIPWTQTWSEWRPTCFHRIDLIGLVVRTAVVTRASCRRSARCWRAFRNRLASFCWLRPPLRPKSRHPCSSMNLSTKDSFMISTTSCLDSTLLTLQSGTANYLACCLLPMENHSHEAVIPTKRIG